MNKYINKKTKEIVQLVSFKGEISKRSEEDFVSYLDSKGNPKIDYGVNLFFDFEKIENNREHYLELSLLDIYDILDSNDPLDFRIYLRQNLKKLYPGFLDKKIYYFSLYKNDNESNISYELLDKIFTKLGLGYNYCSLRNKNNLIEKTLIINRARLIKVTNESCDDASKDILKLTKDCLENGVEINLKTLEDDLITISEIFYNSK